MCRYLSAQSEIIATSCILMYTLDEVLAGPCMYIQQCGDCISPNKREYLKSQFLLMLNASPTADDNPFIVLEYDCIKCYDLYL